MRILLSVALVLLGQLPPTHVRILEPAVMPAPTISAYSNSNATDNVAAEVTASVSWTLGDVVVVLGVTEDNSFSTLGTPTTAGSGLSFSALSGFPSNVNNTCKVYGWSTTASASSSGTITSTGGGSLNRHAIAVWVLSGSDGIGNTSVSSASDTSNPYDKSLTRVGANSAVLLVAGDWNATSDTTTGPSPSSGGTQRLGNNNGRVAGSYTGYFMEWADEGAAGSTSYGVSMDVAGGIFTVGMVEVQGTAGGGGGSVGGPMFDGRTFRGLTFGRVLGSPMQRQHALWQEAARLHRRNARLRRAA